MKESEKNALQQIKEKYSLNSTSQIIETGHLRFLFQQIDSLTIDVAIKSKALTGVLNSCVHPDIAFRAVLVELKPIREAILFNT